VPDDRIAASWERLTDQVKMACGGSLDGSFADTFGTTLRETSRAASLTLENDAACSSSPTHAESTAAGYRADRNGEAMRRAATLATWEDEGGTTAFVE